MAGIALNIISLLGISYYLLHDIPLLFNSTHTIDFYIANRESTFIQGIIIPFIFLLHTTINIYKVATRTHIFDIIQCCLFGGIVYLFGKVLRAETMLLDPELGNVVWLAQLHLAIFGILVFSTILRCMEPPHQQEKDDEKEQ